MDEEVELGIEDRRAAAKMIDGEADHLNRVVTNLLDLSRVEAGGLRVEREVYDLADLLEPTLERARPRLTHHELEVALGGVRPVEVDAVLLDQVLANLLENVAKYTPPGTLVRVGARDLAGEELVRITVEDAGPGAPDTALPHLFEKFYRVPGRSAGSRSGTGVGIPGETVEQELVEHMVFRPSSGSGFRVERVGPGTFAVRGRGIERLLERHDVDNEEAMAYLEGRLRRIGVLRALEAEGFQPGDEIEIGGITFELDPSSA